MNLLFCRVETKAESRLSPLPALAARVPNLKAKGLEEVTSPHSNKQCRSEEDHGIEASKVPPRPIDTLLDVQPQRELIQGERGAHTIKQGHQAARKQRRRPGSRSHFGQPAEPHHKQKQNPPDQMVDMRAVNVDILKRTDAPVGGVRNRTRHRKRHEEPDSRQEKPALRPVFHMYMKKFADF